MNCVEERLHHGTAQLVAHWSVYGIRRKMCWRQGGRFHANLSLKASYSSVNGTARFFEVKYAATGSQVLKRGFMILFTQASVMNELPVSDLSAFSAVNAYMPGNCGIDGAVTCLDWEVSNDCKRCFDRKVPNKLLIGLYTISV